jgi:aryl-alcohol dehydrogenase-like predicted oxidoreductase
VRHTRLGRIGRTGLTVSRLCLGTMNFGPEIDEATSFAVMESALDAGINFVDTADVYGHSNRRGDRQMTSATTSSGSAS